MPLTPIEQFVGSAIDNSASMNRRKIINTVNSSKEVNVLHNGTIVVYTGAHTGRSPGAKFIVDDQLVTSKIDWKNNQKYSDTEFLEALEQAQNYIKGRQISEGLRRDNESVLTQILYAGRDETHQLKLVVHTSFAWQALFANNMFVRSRKSFDPIESWELFCLPDLMENPRVLISFSRKKVIITGTHYAGEIKKSVFTILNFLLPEKNILPMHCSVNTDIDGNNSAIFFGLSGTGKTTLSADSNRILVGDDEHGWSDSGLFNFEGGCYAKVINLSKEAEPEIWDAIQQPGAILENVVVSPDGQPLFDEKVHTENTRGSYPIHHIPNASSSGMCNHPANIVFLTCDAFGVLPPVAKLSIEEAVQHFLMGYTAKVAGTESGITEPVATFSHCFGAPFMPQPPKVYANLLKAKLEKHQVNCWLVNTGWSGGGYNVGTRMPIEASRTIVNLILSGELSQCDFEDHVYTGLSIPTQTANDYLDKYIKPENNWENLEEYQEASQKLMKMWSDQLLKIGAKNEIKKQV